MLLGQVELNAQSVTQEVGEKGLYATEYCGSGLNRKPDFSGHAVICTRSDATRAQQEADEHRQRQRTLWAIRVQSIY